MKGKKIELTKQQYRKRPNFLTFETYTPEGVSGWLLPLENKKSEAGNEFMRTKNNNKSMKVGIPIKIKSK